MPISLKTSGGFALGLTPPAKSKSFQEPGNTSWANINSADNDIPVDKGRIAPIAGDIYKGLAIPVTVNTSESIAVGPWPTGGPIWANSISSGAYDSSNFKGGFFYDDIGGFLYSLNGSLSGTSADSIYRTNMTDGVITKLHGFLPFAFNGETTRLILEPEVPSDPESGDWYIYYQSAVDADFSARVVTSAGVLSEASKFLVDKGGSNQSFSHNGGYVTEDKTLILGNISLIELGQTAYLSMTITRGPSTVRVALPNDGSVFATADTSITSTTRKIVPLVWGTDTVIILSSVSLSIYGRRVMDRPDFDRWLGQIADYYGLPSAEDISPNLTGLSDAVLADMDTFEKVPETGPFTPSPEDSYSGSDIDSEETRMFLLRPIGLIDQMEFNSPGQIDSLVDSNKNLSISAQDSAPRDITCNSDSSSIYMLGNSNSKFYKYNLSTPGDLNTGAFDSDASISFTGRAIVITQDETTIYMLGTESVIYKYTMSTAGDLSSISLDGSIDLSSFLIFPVGIAMGNNDDSIYIADNTGDTISELQFGTQGDVTSLSQVGGDLTIVGNGFGAGFAGNISGSSLYIVKDSTTDRIEKYIRGAAE